MHENRAREDNQVLRLSVIIPTYNERENLPALFEKIDSALRGIYFEAILVDDNSPDGTAELARHLAETRYPWLRVIQRIDERGLATAILTGFREARGEYLAVIDADLQHPPILLPEMLARAEEENADIVVASRYTRGGRVEGWSKTRLLISKGATLLAHILLPPTRQTTDPMSGYFLVKRDLVQSILPRLKPRGYKVLIEVLAHAPNAKVVDIPYTFHQRLRGKSKLGLRTITDYILHLIQLRFRAST